MMGTDLATERPLQEEGIPSQKLTQSNNNFVADFQGELCQDEPRMGQDLAVFERSE